MKVQFCIEYVFDILVLRNTTDCDKFVYTTNHHDDRCDIAVTAVNIFYAELIE